MIQFTTSILKFKENGDKSGWTYIVVPADAAQELMPGNKKAFRVKGFLDSYRIEGISLLPFGGGNFIMALNATVRKGIRKKEGSMLQVKIEADNKPILPPQEFLDCLADEPKAEAFFNKLSKSGQSYFSNWIREAKTESTKAKRIAQAVTGLAWGLNFGETIRAIKAEKL